MRRGKPLSTTVTIGGRAPLYVAQDKENATMPTSATRDDASVLREARALLAEPYAVRTDDQISTALAERLPTIRGTFRAYESWKAYCRQVLTSAGLFTDTRDGQGEPDFDSTSQGKALSPKRAREVVAEISGRNMTRQEHEEARARGVDMSLTGRATPAPAAEIALSILRGNVPLDPTITPERAAQVAAGLFARGWDDRGRHERAAAEKGAALSLAEQASLARLDTAVSPNVPTTAAEPAMPEARRKVVVAEFLRAFGLPPDGPKPAA